MTPERTHSTSYEARLSRVTNYIYDHLDDDIDLRTLADVACLSQYHFHRIYHAVRGETIAAAVKRLRLQRAAAYLAQTSVPIKAVAERSGYKNVESFTRLFSAVYGMPPAQYRRKGSHMQFRPNSHEGDWPMYELTIKAVPAMNAVAMEHVGSPLEVGKAFDALYGWLGARNLLSADMRPISIYRDDPSIVPEKELRLMAGVVVRESFPVETPVQMTQISAGTYAILRHKGPYANMKAAYAWLFGTWLPQSGHDAADAPVFEEYLNNPRETAPTDLMTDIYLPLR